MREVVGEELVAGCEAEADVGAGNDAGLSGEAERLRQV